MQISELTAFAGIMKKFFEQHGFTIVLGGDHAEAQGRYQDTVLPPLPARRLAEEKPLPEKLRQMRRLYEYTDASFRQKCKNFCRQGKFMEDYEDDVPWRGDFRQYFPTYHDLRAEQLRGYFTWRAAARRGVWESVPTSLAYLYIYELLNGIGAQGPEDSLEKLRAFERGYLDSGLGEAGIRKNLRRWMLELAVVKGLPPERIRAYADADTLARDEALAVLRRPGDHGDGEIFGALCLLGSARLAASPVIERHGDEGRRLFAEVWRQASARYRGDGKTLFTACFGGKRTCRWHPLGNAVYYEREKPADRVVALNDCRVYLCRDGVWKEQSWQKLSFDKALFTGLLREADRRLRLYLKTGRPLRERPEDLWAAPFIEAAIEDDRARRREAERRKISIRFDALDQIRQDAARTRESLLTEDELWEDAGPAPTEASAEALPLDDEQLQLMALLLRGESARPWLAERHALASVIADGINEALFDALGDAAVDCDGTDITLVEDYREDIRRILGGAYE